MVKESASFVQKNYKPHQERSDLAECFYCGNMLPFFIKQEKLIEISLLIYVHVRLIQKWDMYKKYKIWVKGIQPFQQPSYLVLSFFIFNYICVCVCSGWWNKIGASFLLILLGIRSSLCMEWIKKRSNFFQLFLVAAGAIFREWTLKW